jgi:Family of unknown function (DUF6029)
MYLFMKLLKPTLLFLSCLILTQNVESQVADSTISEVKYLSGSLQANGNFYLRDSAIGAANIPQYDRQLVGADAWLNLNYSRSGYDIGVRFDFFQNSQLLNPKASYSASGLGRWYVKKRIDRLSIYAGFVYDQIGSGIIFRAYEERPLAIDNALLGANLTYDLTENWKIKAFTGRQKQQFDLYKSSVSGFNTEGYVSLGKVSLAPGFGIVHRNLDDETVNQVVSSLATYSLADSIGASYNTYASTLYNTLSAGKWTWYVEAAYKTPEVMFDPFAQKLNRNGTVSEGKLINRSGSIIYSNLGFVTEGFGITFEGKRTEGFTFRTTPLASLNRGTLNFLPPMSRQNTYRLTSRYVPATQELGEQAFQVDVKYAPKENMNIDVNLSNISNLNNDLLYREIYVSLLFKKEHSQLTLGMQHQTYNQQIYEVKPNVPYVQTITPFVEYIRSFSDTKSLKIEAQYMNNKQDYGSWIFGLVEYSVAPKWVFTVSDMFNFDPKKTKEALHYPTLAVVYAVDANRFSLAYVKQVEGVVCTGGICRLEPAFSGVRLSVNSNF